MVNGVSRNEEVRELMKVEREAHERLLPNRCEVSDQEFRRAKVEEKGSTEEEWGKSEEGA